MHVHRGRFERLRGALVASAVALLTAAPALAAEAAQPAASGYVPTMADYLGIYDALQNYRIGVEKHDEAARKAAFWDDADRGGARNAGPPPGMAPPPGAAVGPAGPGGGRAAPPSWDEIKKMPGFVEVWHMPLDSYIHFESATRATHYEYFLSIYPQPEKKVEGANMGNMQNARTSIVGWPGHYDDILEKRHGEWRILQRKMGMNEK